MVSWVRDTDRLIAKQKMSIALSDEDTPLTGVSTTVPLATFHMPYEFNVSEVKAGLTHAGTGAALVQCDIKSNGSSILTTLITIDATEKTSATAAAQAVLATVPVLIPEDALIECFLYQVDTGGVAAGLKIYMIGNQVSPDFIPEDVPVELIAPTFLPIDNAVSVAVDDDLVMTFVGGSDLDFNLTALTVETDGVEAVGSWSSDGNSATYALDPGEEWTADAPITVEGASPGTVVVGGVELPIIAFGVGVWDMTTDSVSPPPPPPTDSLYFRDMSDSGFSIPHELSEAEAKAYFNAGYFTGASAGRVWLVDDPATSGRGTVLRIDYKTGGISAQYGAQAGIPITPASELYLAHDLYFPSGYIFPFTQKLLALMSDKHVIPSTVGSQTWAAFGAAGDNADVDRLTDLYGGAPITEIDGEIRMNRDDADKQVINKATGVAHGKGTWEQLEIYVKNNTVGSSNGVFKAWRNGSQIYSKTDVKWISSVDPSVKWENILLHYYVGGGSLAWMHAQNQSIYIDNITLSLDPITH